MSVAIGELTDLDIYLDRVPTKYSGLNATELAISESQEPGRRDRSECRRGVQALLRRENIEVTHVADVTDSRRMRMYNKGKLVVDLSREFIDRRVPKHYAQAAIGAVEERDPFRRGERRYAARKDAANLADDNVLAGADRDVRF